MKFKKYLAMLMAATVVMTGGGFSNLTYAAETLQPNAEGVYTITSANLRVNDNNLVYNGKVQKPQVYVDMDGDQTYSSGDYLITDSANKTIENSLVATKAGSNVNASDSATVKLPANTYEDSFTKKVGSNSYARYNATFKIDEAITIPYKIGKLNLSSATIKINGKGNDAATADFSVDEGVKLTLNGTESTGADNVVNVYDNHGVLLTDVTGISISNTGDKDAVEGASYTATIKADANAQNFVSGSSKDCGYKARLNILSGATITFKDAYKDLTYNGDNQKLDKNAVSKVTLGDKNLDLNGFDVKVCTEPYGNRLRDFDALAGNTEKQEAYAKEKGFASAADLKSKLTPDSITDAGTYYLVLVSKNMDSVYYSGYAETSYTIKKLDISKWGVVKGIEGEAGKVVYNVVDAENLKYTGAENKPTITAKVQNGTIGSKDFSIADKNLTVEYKNNVNATQANAAYVEKLTALGLAKTTDGVVEIYKIGDGFPVGCGDTTKTYDDMDAAIKKAYDSQDKWKKAVTDAQNAYLPQAILTFNDKNITGSVTASNAFEIKQFDLAEADIKGAEIDGNSTTSGYSYSISEDDPIKLGVDGIQVKKGAVVYPSDILKVGYSYANRGEDTATAFKDYAYTPASKFSLVGGTNTGVQAVKMVIAAGNNNLTGSKVAYFTTAKSLNDTAVTLKLKNDSVVYSGASVKGSIAPKMEMPSGTLAVGTDYELNYYKADGETQVDPIEVGTYVVKARGKGDYAGTLSKTFTITPKSIDAKTNNVSDVSMTGVTIKYKKFESDAIMTAETAGGKRIVTYGSTVVDTDYNASVRDSKAGALGNLVYGSQYTIAFVNDNEPTKDIAMADVKDCGTYSIYMVGKGNYTGRLDSGFDLVVAPQPLSDANVTITKTADSSKSTFAVAKNTPIEIYYTGSKITLDQLGITVKGFTGTKANELKEGTDYVASITTDATEVGEVGEVKITCPENSSYSATNITAKFKVVAGQLNNANVYSVELENGNDVNYAHDSEPKFTIKDKRTGAIIPQEFNNSKINYKARFDFSNPVGVNGGKLIISTSTEGNSSYSGNYQAYGIATTLGGQRELTFNTILSVEKLAYGGIVDNTIYDYDGTNKLPQITVENTDGTELKKDTDYKVTIMNAEETKTFDTITEVLRTSDKEMNVKGDLVNGLRTTTMDDYVEYYHVIVEGINKCVGKKVFHLGVRPVSVRSTAVQITAEDQTYTGEYLKPVVVKYGDTVLKEGTDYEISYQNNKDVGTATYVVRGKGNFDGSYSIYDSDPAQFEIKASEEVKTYTKEEIQQKIDDAVKDATKDMISKTDAETAKNQAVADATKDMVSKTEADAAKEQAVADATKDLYTKAQLDAAVAEATKDLYTKAQLDAAVAEATKDVYTKAQLDAAVAEATKDVYTKAQLDTAVADATKDMISKADADAAKNQAVADATKDMISKTDAENAKNQAVADATKDMISKADADAAKNQAVADATKDMVSKAEADSKVAEAEAKAAEAKKAQETAEAAQKDAETKAAEAEKTAVAETVKKGQQVVYKNNIYKVTNVSKKTLTFVGTMSTAKTIKIAKSVKINGTKFKVTAIAKNALKGNKTAKKVVIPSTVKSIGKKAFANMNKNIKFNATAKVKKLANKAK